MGQIGFLLTKWLELGLHGDVLLFFNLVRHLPIEIGELRLLLGFVELAQGDVFELLLRLEMA